MSDLFATVDFRNTPISPEWADGCQPLSSPDGRLHLVADARLDNRAELLTTLEVDDPTISDPGLLLAAWQRWGSTCPAHLDGDFAFAVWDAVEHHLHAVRDPLGQRTLCYARCGGLVLVADEARRILAHPAVEPRIDERSAALFLNGEPLPTDRTFFHGLHALPGGSQLTATSEDLRAERFWDIDPEDRLKIDVEEAAERLATTLRRSVAVRSRTTGAAVGVTLSGGLDSGAVAAFAQDALASGPRPLIAASFVYDELQECDERPFLRSVREHLGIEGLEIPAEPHTFLSDHEIYQPTLETPFMAWESAYHAMLGPLQARGVKVLLTGHGGDGGWWGSPMSYADRLRRGDFRVIGEIVRQASLLRGKTPLRALYHHLVPPLLPATSRFLDRLRGRHTSAPSSIPAWIDSSFAQRTGLTEPHPKPPRRFREMTRQRIYTHVVTHEGDATVTAWLARNAARFGIEVRHPFLDRQLIELLLALPPEHLYTPGLGKSLVRRALTGALPEAVRMRRDKTRFHRFIDLGLRHRERRHLEELLKAPRLADLGMVDPEQLRAAYRRYADGETSLDAEGHFVWLAVLLEIWLLRYDLRP